MKYIACKFNKSVGWRVSFSVLSEMDWGKVVVSNWDETTKILIVKSDRSVKDGQFCNPRKLLGI